MIPRINNIGIRRGEPAGCHDLDPYFIFVNRNIDLPRQSYFYIPT